ncbi:hypothetical protein V2I01_42695 [Micromonospora sp. BRA006-A]|nr:hypothetical protein [Micromonospora sp. BRA006-A]
MAAGNRTAEDLGTEQRDALNFAYRTTLSNVDPRLVAGDPAAWASDFGYALNRVAIRLDNRTNDELRPAALHHADPAMREQAMYSTPTATRPTPSSSWSRSSGTTPTGRCGGTRCGRSRSWAVPGDLDAAEVPR